MSWLNSTRAILLLNLVITAVLIPAFNAQAAPVSAVRARYIPGSDKWKITFSAVLSYRLVLINPEGGEIARRNARHGSAKFDAALLIDGARYTLAFEPLSGGKTVTKTVLFSTRVKTESKVGEVLARNESGRGGAYFLPRNYAFRSLPLLVGFHGSGGAGIDVVRGFKGSAELFDFIVLAPDSRFAPSVGTYTWEVPDEPGGSTPDYEHILNCIDELLAIPHLTIDRSHVLVVGVSAGGAVASGLGTNEEIFTALAVLHGGIVPENFGARRVPSWFSTGSADDLRPPGEVQEQAALFESLGFPDVRYEEYPYGHRIGAPERRDLFTWWLN